MAALAEINPALIPSSTDRTYRAGPEMAAPVVAHSLEGKDRSTRFEHEQMDLNLRYAFSKNTNLLHCLFRRRAVGWTVGTRKELFVIREAIAHHVQVWNDTYTDPAGAKQDTVQAPAADTVHNGYRLDATGYTAPVPASGG